MIIDEYVSIHLDGAPWFINVPAGRIVTSLRKIGMTLADMRHNRGFAEITKECLSEFSLNVTFQIPSVITTPAPYYDACEAIVIEGVLSILEKAAIKAEEAQFENLAGNVLGVEFLGARSVIDPGNFEHTVLVNSRFRVFDSSGENFKLGNDDGIDE